MLARLRAGHLYFLGDTMHQHFIIEDGCLTPAKRGSTINTAGFKVQLDCQRYKVSADEFHHKFLIDFGLHENQRSTIICANPGEMLIALALVKAALAK